MIGLLPKLSIQGEMGVTDWPKAAGANGSVFAFFTYPKACQIRIVISSIYSLSVTFYFLHHLAAVILNAQCT